MATINMKIAFINFKGQFSFTIAQQTDTEDVLRKHNIDILHCPETQINDYS